jgi:hypothetical protein
MKNIAIIIIHNAIGDFITNNGFIHYLVQYYDKVIITTPFVPFVSKNTHEYINCLFSDIKQQKLETKEFSNIEKYIIHIKKIDNNVKIDIFKNILGNNLQTLKFKCNKLLYNYYLKTNKKKWTIESKYIFNEADTSIKDNGTMHYINQGLNKFVRLDYFNFNRNLDEENKIYNEIIQTNNIEANKYNIICEGQQCDKVLATIDRKYITNDYQNINIHNLVNNPLYLIKLFENANQIHLIENSHCLMVYYLQYKQLMHNNNIHYHTYARKRPEAQKDFYNMVLNPQLDNWIIYS